MIHSDRIPIIVQNHYVNVVAFCSFCMLNTKVYFGHKLALECSDSGVVGDDHFEKQEGCQASMHLCYKP